MLDVCVRATKIRGADKSIIRLDEATVFRVVCTNEDEIPTHRNRQRGRGVPQCCVRVQSAEIKCSGRICQHGSLDSGANVKVVQQMLGHKSATLTLDLYGHLFPDQLDQVADALDAARAAAVAQLLPSAKVIKLVAGYETATPPEIRGV